MFSEIKKRNGQIVPCDWSKVEKAVASALIATGETPKKLIPLQAKAISTRVEANLGLKHEGETGSIPEVEEIQNEVEKALMASGLYATAKAYILYRKQHEGIRKTEGTVLDYASTVNKYLKVADWRVKENATVTYSIGGLILSNSGAITANYWLSEVYDQEVANAHRNCDLHIHDLSMLSAYCAGWSLKQLIQEGLGGVPGKITSAPASHLSTLTNQMVNFLGIMQNEWAG